MHSSLKLSVAANAGIKVLALIVSLLSTPLTMSFFRTTPFLVLVHSTLRAELDLIL